MTLVTIGACLTSVAAGFWLGLSFTGWAGRAKHRFHDPEVSVQATIERALAGRDERERWPAR